MTPLLSLVAQLLHIGLMLVAAPTWLGLRRCIEARVVGEAGADPWQPWRDLRRLVRKQAIPAEGTTLLSQLAPTACFACAVLAAALVPSFTVGMALAPLADLLVLAGLLALPPVVLALAAMEGGTALGGLAASRAATAACFAEPVLYLLIFTLGWLGGTTNLDLLIGQQHEAALRPVAATALIAAALVVVALRDATMAADTTEFSAVDLALLQGADALRLLIWCDLLGGLFLPIGMAEIDAGPLAWLIGLGAWVVKLASFAAAVALIRAATAHPRLRHRQEWFAVAALLGLIAALLVAASAVAA